MWANITKTVQEDISVDVYIGIVTKYSFLHQKKDRWNLTRTVTPTNNPKQYN